MPRTKKTSANRMPSSLFTKGSLRVFLFLISISLPLFSQAAINPQINYQGKLNDASGNIVSDGSYNMVFKIYDTASGGVPLWTGNHTTSNGNPVSVSSGVFSILLGSGTGNSLDLDFSGDTYYLGVTIGTDSEMAPRKRIGSVPQAYNANNLNGDGYIKISGLPTGAQVDEGTVYINPASATASYTLLGVAVNGSQKMKLDAGGNLTLAGNVGIGQTSPTAYLHIKAGTAAANTAPIKLASGTNLTTPEAGALEFNGTDLFFTPSATRETIAFMSDLAGASHDAVTLAGTPDYLTLAGQEITLNQIDLTADITGTLPTANGGTGVANGSNNTITFTGNYSLGLTLAGATSVVLPASGTLATTSQIVTDHGTLAGLLDDDHTQYAILAGRSGGQTFIGGTGTTDDLIFQTTSGVGVSGADMIFQVGNNGGTEAMRILNSGYVGIGIAAPGSALDIKGTLRLSGSTSGYVGLSPAAVAGSTTYTLPSADGTNGQALSTNGSGTLSWTTVGGSLSWSSLTNPAANLALAMGTYTSTFTYNAATGANNLFNLTDTASNTGTGYLLNVTTATGSALNPFHVSAAGTEAITVLANGYVGIGTTSPAFKLQVSGDIGPNNAPVTTTTSQSITVLDSVGDVGDNTSIAIGADGLPVISYYDTTNGNLKVCKCSNTSCTAATCTAIDSTGNVGDSTSIAIGADGLPVVSYHDITNQDLKVCKCSNASCTAATCSTVDSVGYVGSYQTSIKIGADGLPVIAYFNNTNFYLKVCKCSNVSCTAATCSNVDTTPNSGQYPSIAIGTDGLPVVAYPNVLNADLKVCKCSNASCSTAATCTTLDSVGDVGNHTSIAIGADGLPVISYYDNTNYRLKACKCSNTSCTAAACSVVDSVSGSGLYTSIAIGTDGLPVIAHYQSSDSALRVCKCSNASCSTAATCTAVDSVGTVGYYPSITIGTDGLPAVSYTDLTNHNLKVVKCADTSCSGSSGTAFTGGSLLGGGSTPFQTVNAIQIANPTTFQNLSFSTAGSEKLVITPSGNVGIGMTAPSNLLSLYGATPVMDIETSDAAIIDGDDLGTIQFRGLDTTQTHLVGAMIRAEAADTWDGDDVDNAPTELQFFTEDNTTDDHLATPRMVIDQFGNVGIGTATPGAKLDIAQTITATGALKGIVYTGAINTNQTLSTEIPSLTLTTAGREWATGALTTQREVLITAPTYSFVGASTITDAATVGIAGAPIAGTNATLTNSHGLLIQAGAVAAGTTNSYGLTVNTQTGASNNYAAAFLGGNVGIGIASPTALLHLDGSAGKVSLEINSNETTAASNVLMLRSDVASANDPIFRVQADGAVFADGAYTATGADYAEYFATQDTDLKSGEAVCVDTQKDNAVKRCSRSGDNDIMGVVSNHPSIVGNSADGREEDSNFKVIAMLGQIAANVNNENGAIQIGDSLTSADTPGYLRKADAGESTVGVAMQEFNGKQGSVQILISRRNKSLTVEKVEEAVTQRIADMDVQDQVDKMIDDATTKLAKNTEAQLMDIGNRVITLETLANGYGTRIKTQEDLAAQLQIQIDELKKLNNTELNLAQIEANKTDIEYLKLVLGIDRAENGSVNVLGKLEADGIIAGVFTVKIVDEESRTIGAAVIKAITKDEDKDGIDDETGSDGKSVVVKTKAVGEDSKVFVTPETPVEIGVNSLEEGKSFKIEIGKPTEKDLKTDWWIVKSH